MRVVGQWDKRAGLEIFNIARMGERLDCLFLFVFFLQAIINILKRHYSKHNYSAILQVLPILKAFNAIQPDFYVTLQVSSLLGFLL